MHKAGGRVLVSGGAGYIGSVLVPMLLGQGKLVTLLDVREPSTNDHWANLPNDHLRLVVGDIRSEEVIQESLRDVESIIYLAGVSDGRAGKANPDLTHSVNVDGFQRFVSRARASGCRRFVFASTFGVYGYGYREPLVESLPADPQEPYSLSKLKAEQLLHALNTSTFETVSLRSAMVYGHAPNLRLDFLVNRLVHDALIEGHIQVLGGSQVRPQIHVRDLCRYFAELITLPGADIAGQVFNACGFNKSILEVALEIKAALHNDVMIHVMPGRPNETSFCLSQEKLTRSTGLTPAVTLPAAVHEFKQNHSLIQALA